MKRCRDGDPEAWRTLLPHFQALGRRALRSFRLSNADSDDVLSDALTSLYGGGLSQFRGETMPQFLAFLKAVVRNRAIDFVNEQRKWSGPPNEVDPEAPDAVIVRPDSDDISRRVAEDECLEILRQEVSRLTREDRELYLMKAHGLKEREIAQQTGQPPGTISSRIARLRERLRSALADRGCL